MGEFLTQMADEFGLAAGILVSLALIWRYGVWPTLKFVRALVRVADSLEETVPTLRDIAIEFEPNGGNSLKEQIERIDANVHVTNENLGSIYKMVAAMDTDPALMIPLKPLQDTPPPLNGD